MQRPGASQGSTRQLKDGDECTLIFETGGDASYTVEVIYSNDGVGPGEVVHIIVDGTDVGHFEAEATGTSGNETGPGWDVFLQDLAAAAVPLEPGTHELKITIGDGDELGIEIDAVILEAV